MATPTNQTALGVPPSPPQDAALALDQALHHLWSQCSMGLSPIALTLAYLDWALHLGSSPGRQQLLLQQGLTDLAQAAQAVSAPAEADADARFQHPGWQHWPYHPLKEAYKSQAAQWLRATQLDGMSAHHRQMVGFFARQWLDALSPSNWPWSNPEVLQKAWDTAGASWLKGWQQYLTDLSHAPALAPGSRPAPEGSTADATALPPLPFEVGKDVAVTPGKVVFRNRLIELIQYQASTAEVYAEPLLIVPSCIMKYYILDLSPHNSMVRYLVNQGHTVFMISWRNPDASDRELGLDDYVRLGLLDAMAAVQALTGAPRLHAMGYCLGGTFLAIAAAVLGERAPRGSRRRADLPQLASVTLLAAQTDFSEPGELGVFIDPDQLQTLREEMARTGYLSGRQMAGAFQFLNARDLIWSRNAHRYWLGEDEVSMDMLSWNADTTRLPQRMHNEYLNALFLNNALAQGHFQFEGKGVALMNIQAPLLVVGTGRDHVSPWRSVYKIHLLTNTDITFILAAGGHNAGIVSEPGRAHRSHQWLRTDAGQARLAPEQWLQQAQAQEGSWWPTMQQWLAGHSGKRIKRRVLAASQALCDAPGDYVKVRYAD